MQCETEAPYPGASGPSRAELDSGPGSFSAAESRACETIRRISPLEVHRRIILFATASGRRNLGLCSNQESLRLPAPSSKRTGPTIDPKSNGLAGGQAVTS